MKVNMKMTDKHNRTISELIYLFVSCPLDHDRIRNWILTRDNDYEAWVSDPKEEVKKAITSLRKATSQPLVVDQDNAALSKAENQARNGEKRSWIPISAWEADRLLNSLPPKLHTNNGFVAGDPYSDTIEGETVWITVRQLNGYSVRFSTIEEFKNKAFQEELPPIRVFPIISFN